jgi:hypothetical protein
MSDWKCNHCKYVNDKCGKNCKRCNALHYCIRDKREDHKHKKHKQYKKVYSSDIMTNINSTSLQDLCVSVTNYSDRPVTFKAGGKELLNQMPKEKSSRSISYSEPKKLVGILHSAHREDLSTKLSQLLGELFSEDSDIGYLFFRVSGLDMNKGTAEGVICSSQGIYPTTSSIPTLIYNLALHSKPFSFKVMRKLRTNPKIKVLNPINSFQQDVLFDIISTHPHSDGFLLAHQPFKKSSFEKLLNSNNQLFLTPNRTYRHPEAMTISRRKEERVSIKIGKMENILPSKYAFNSIKMIIRNRRFNILEGVKTLKWNGHPAECRVYVQKDGTGMWNITSRILKNDFFTKGSVFHRHSENLERALVKFNESIAETSLKETAEVPVLFASYLDYFIPNVGSYYFDFLLDSTGHPYLFYIGGVERTNFLARSSKNDWENYLTNLISYLDYCGKEIKSSGFDKYVD